MHSRRVSNKGGRTNEFLVSVPRFRAFPDTRAWAEPADYLPVSLFLSLFAVVNLIQVDCLQVSTLTFSVSALGRPYHCGVSLWPP